LLGSVALVSGLMMSMAAPASAQAATCDPASSFQVTTASLPIADEFQGYGAQLEANGGTQPYTFSISHGSLPSGVILTPTGAITGVPLAHGSFSFGVTASDSANPPGCDTADLLLVVQGSIADPNDLLAFVSRRADPACLLGAVGTLLGRGPHGGC
jgi:hypothetical protein